ncbi:MAG: FkbM family methyltransferase [Bryobacteraceae bacterium]
MRILLAHNSPYYPAFGGGDKSNRLLMESLAARGHRVRVAARVERFGQEAQQRLLAELGGRGIPASGAADCVRFCLNGVEVHILTLQPHVRAWFSSQITAFDPDVILTSTDDPAHLMLEPALRSPRARVVYLVRATVALPFGPDTSFASGFKTAILRQADGVAAVSEYVAGYARRWGGLEAVYVPISLLEPGEFPYVGRFDNRFVTMVNPCAVKGISIFLALARRFPGTGFAAVPTWGTTAADLAALHELPNISVLAPVDDIHEILQRTRVVLAPSLWAEARSRMILEAMARGIPVVASQVGGLGEAMLGMDYLVPVRAVVHYHSAVDELMVPAAEIPEQDIGPWQAVLERLLTDRAHYERLSAASRHAALAYAGSLTCLPFEAYLEKIVQSPRRREAATIAGSPQPGLATAGSPNPSSAAAGAPIPGSALTASPQPSSAAAGAPIPGSALTASPQPSSAAAGSLNPVPAIAGSPNPSSAAAGSPNPSPALAGPPTPRPAFAGSPIPNLAIAGSPNRGSALAASPTPSSAAAGAKPPLSPEKQRLLALLLRRKLAGAPEPAACERETPMWLTELQIRELDAPTGRAELSSRSTQLAREALPGCDIEIFWDGIWIRRVGPVWFPDPDLFRTAEPNWQRWAGLAEKYLRDAEDYWFHVYKPRPGDVIADIGAGRGEDVFAFAKAVGPAGRVFAIEPHPVSFQALEKFCALNRLSNVTALNYACTDQPARLQIETLPVWESNYVRSGDRSPTSYPVEGLPFDSLFAGRGVERIDFLKMNIEGAERLALPGCRAMLARTRFVCIAAHDFRAARGEGEHFRTLEFVSRFLTQAGFEILTRSGDPRYYVPYHVHGFRSQSVSGRSGLAQ